MGAHICIMKDREFYLIKRGVKLECMHNLDMDNPRLGKFFKTAPGAFSKYNMAVYKKTIRSLEGPWYENDTEFYSREQLEDMMAWIAGGGDANKPIDRDNMMLYYLQDPNNITPVNPILEMTSNRQMSTDFKEELMSQLRSVSNISIERDEQGELKENHIRNSAEIGNVMHLAVIQAKVAKKKALYILPGKPSASYGPSHASPSGMSQVYTSADNLISDLYRLHEAIDGIRSTGKQPNVSGLQNGIFTFNVRTMIDSFPLFLMKDFQENKDDSYVKDVIGVDEFLNPHGFKRVQDGVFKKALVDGSVTSQQFLDTFGLDIRFPNWNMMSLVTGVNNSAISATLKRNGHYKTFIK